MKLLLISFYALLISSLSWGYFIAVPNSQQKNEKFNYNLPSRILISGRGTDLGLAPQISALTRALLYQVNFPGEQVILISVLENSRNQNLLKKANWKIVKENSSVKFDTDSIYSELIQFSKISSIDFFGHNSPSSGTQTDGLGYRFDFRKAELTNLKNHFLPYSYVMIHGCNSGWLIASNLAKLWNIPVSGAFTETRFEHLNSDGHFYVYDVNKGPVTPWAIRNSDLANQPECSVMGCLRMRPKYSSYIGKWGDYSGPLLGHYKFFCPLSVDECQKTMAYSLYGFIGEHSLRKNSSEREFRALVKEYLCPLDRTRELNKKCIQELTLIDQGIGNKHISFNFHQQQLSCDFNSCSAVMTCDDHRCEINFLKRDSKKQSPASTFVDEYLNFIAGFHSLHKQSNFP